MLIASDAEAAALYCTKSQETVALDESNKQYLLFDVGGKLSSSFVRAQPGPIGLRLFHHLQLISRQPIQTYLSGSIGGGGIVPQEVEHKIR